MDEVALEIQRPQGTGLENCQFHGSSIRQNENGDS